MSKVRCYDPKYLKAGKKQPGYNCEYFDRETSVCKAKRIGGGKYPKVFPSKSRKCPFYKERESEP